jgi:hypothetical protein
MNVRFQVLTAAIMKFRDDTSLMMEAARTSETSVDNYFTRQYIPEDNSEQQIMKLFIAEISPVSYQFVLYRYKYFPQYHVCRTPKQ